MDEVKVRVCGENIHIEENEPDVCSVLGLP